MSSRERRHNAVTPSAVALTILLAVAGALSVDAGSDGAIFILVFVMVVVVTISAGTRPVRDPDFTVGRRFGEYNWRLFWRGLGPLGIIVATVYCVIAWQIDERYDTPDLWMDPKVIAAVVLLGLALILLPATPLRQIGSGLIVGAVGPVSAAIGVYLMVFTIPLLLLYTLLSVICWFAASHPAPVPPELDDVVASDDR